MRLYRLAFNSAGNLFAADNASNNIYAFSRGTRSAFASGLKWADISSLRAYSHSDANSDTDSYGDHNSKPEPDRGRPRLHQRRHRDLHQHLHHARLSAPAALEMVAYNP